MPTYLCTIPAGSLGGAQKAAVAKAITRVHGEITGAPAYFAEVIFKEIAPGDWFIGGAPIEGPQIFVHGNIRGGRPAEMLNKLITQIAIEVGAAGQFPSHSIWVYLSQLPASAMLEFGHVLPEPGHEDTWTAGLSPDDRIRMQKIGR